MMIEVPRFLPKASHATYPAGKAPVTTKSAPT
jgi:hypothetical protein